MVENEETSLDLVEKKLLITIKTNLEDIADTYFFLKSCMLF